MKTVAIIPVRYDSTRLPGKPLADILGKPMIQWVWEAAKSVRIIDEVLIATDDQRIEAAAREFGARTVITSHDCLSGTDRVKEAMKTVVADIYINIQGDEPLIVPGDLEKLVNGMLNNPDIPVGTLCAPIDSEMAKDPNIVKVVLDNNNKALYFSRSQIPFPRDEVFAKYWGHLGAYAYRPHILENFSSLPVSNLEKTEKLEQLRLLQAGITIHVVEASKMTMGVDTYNDLEKVRNILAGSPENGALSSKLKNIRLIITDIDGVLTDGSLYYGENGETTKKFNARDGLGAVLAKKAGIKIAVASGRDCPALRARLKDLGIDNFVLGNLNKMAAAKKIMDGCSVSPDETLFIGDDITDLAAFECCAMGVAPKNAEPSVTAAAGWETQAKGGEGVLREVIDRILIAQGFNSHKLFVNK